MEKLAGNKDVGVGLVLFRILRAGMELVGGDGFEILNRPRGVVSEIVKRRSGNVAAGDNRMDFCITKNARLGHFPPIDYSKSYAATALAGWNADQQAQHSDDRYRWHAARLQPSCLQRMTTKAE